MSIHEHLVRWYRSAFRDRAVAGSFDGGTHHHIFTSRHQKVAFGAALGVSVWAIVASTAYVVTAVQSSRQIDDLEVGYANLIVDVNRQVQGAVAQSESNARYVAQVAALQADRDALLERLSALGALAAAIDTARRDVEADRAALRADIDAVRHDLLSASTDVATLEQALARRDAELAVTVRARNAVSEEAALLRDRVAGLSGRLADAEGRNARLGDRVATLSETIASAQQQIAAAQSDRLGLVAELHEQHMISADLESHLRNTMAAAVRLSSDRDLLADQAERLRGEIALLEGELADRQVALADAERVVRDVTVTAVDLSTERNALRDENGTLESRVVRLEADLAEQQTAREDLLASLRDVTVSAAGLAAENAELRDASGANEARVARLEADLAEQQIANDRLAADLRDATASAAVLAERNSALSDVNVMLESRFALVAADLAAQRAARDNLETILRDTTVASVDMSTERNVLLDANGALRGQVGALEARMSGLATYQEEMFAQLRDAIDEYVWGVEQGLAVTGLDIEALIEDIYGAEFYGVGGPMIPLLDEHIAGQPGWIDAIETIALTDRAVELRDVANQLPIGLPVDAEVPMSSGFGPRRDPLNGGGAMHQGLDFDGDRGDAIRATGPGTVVRADWYSGFGRTVEIDHGFGLVSRYAHLQEILVEEGQPIGYSEPIGLMGSSGRTTGSHLHYEVLVNGVPHDPMNFIRAGEHVYEIATTQDSQ